MRTRVLCAGLLITQVALAACTGTPATRTFRPTFKKTPCPEDVTSVVLTPATCGFLTVLEDRSKPDGRTIKLFVVRVEPAGGHPAPDPVFVAGDLGEAPGWADNAGLAQRVNREVILLDPRGTGHSEPNLECPEVSSLDEELVGSRLSDPATRQDLRKRCGRVPGPPGRERDRPVPVRPAGERGRCRGPAAGPGDHSVEPDVPRDRPRASCSRWCGGSPSTSAPWCWTPPRSPRPATRSRRYRGRRLPSASSSPTAPRSRPATGDFPDLPHAMREAVAQLDRTPIEVKVSDSGAASQRRARDRA